jgi:hypothetical protein
MRRLRRTKSRIVVAVHELIIAWAIAAWRRSWRRPHGFQISGVSLRIGRGRGWLRGFQSEREHRARKPQ